MFDVCVIGDDYENCLLIEEQLNDFFFNQNIHLEMEFLSLTTFSDPKIWRDSNHDLAVIDISNTKTREKLMAHSVKIRTVCHKTKVIFLSDDLSCALDTFDYYPDYFIYKPQIEARLISAVEHLFEFKSEPRENNLIVSTRTTKYVIPEKMIVYFEHYQHNTKIVCKDKVINCNEKLSDIIERLNKNYFIRCHCSFVVNLNEVTELRRNQMVVCNGDIIPCSRANQKAVKIAFETLQEHRKNA